MALPELQRQQRAPRERSATTGRQRANSQRPPRIEAEEAAARPGCAARCGRGQGRGTARQRADAGAASRAAERRAEACRARRCSRPARRARVAGEQADDAARDAAANAATRAAERRARDSSSFAATGLLSAALAAARPARPGQPWTIDPALTLARRAEQALSELKDDDDAWTRVQAADHARTSPSCSARSARSATRRQAEQSDWGLVVHIIYQNRPERPDRSPRGWPTEIAQRRELLTANEREVLENHLQAEIAAEVQRLLQAAERSVDAINTRTATSARPPPGVRFRLLWQPLAEEEGAPVGLEAARKRLLNTSCRPVVGRGPRAWSAPCCSSASPPSASAPMRARRTAAAA